MTFAAMTSPTVLHFEGRAFSRREDHIQWRVDYASLMEFDTGTYLPVYGSLRAGGAGGWAEISVAALIAGVEEVPGDELADTLKESEAIETLYDFARASLSGMLGTVNAGFVLDAKAPDVEVGLLEADDDDEEPENLHD